MVSAVGVRYSDHGGRDGNHEEQHEDTDGAPGEPQRPSVLLDVLAYELVL
jgi:hypothetical protein